jgi:predicted RNase H-like nuclease (RuvC/YqgF family)
MRRRSEPHTFGQRLAAQRQRLERELASLPDDHQRDAVAARIEQLQAAAEMFEFLSTREASVSLR